MAKVTYIFGAGASKKSLPLVTEIPAELKKFQEFIINNRVGDDTKVPSSVPPQTYYQVEEGLINKCERLAIYSGKHSSIDTYAKKLLINGQNEDYETLKSILSIFFQYLQSIREVDSRYDLFFASLLSTVQNVFSGDVRILSWNYDFQFEKAYLEYHPEKDLSRIQTFLHVYPDGLVNYIEKDVFSIFKLNGTSDFRSLEDKDYRFYYDLRNNDKTELYKRIIRFFANSDFDNPFRSAKSMISFAWEKEEEVLKGQNKYFNFIEDQIKDSTTVVSIGYSFLFFNRTIDRTIFGFMKNSISKIYVQAPNADEIIEKLPSILPPGRKIGLNVEAILINQVKEFHLPPEL